MLAKLLALTAAFALSVPAMAQDVGVETILHSFNSKTDGNYPSGSLVTDESGALYGTTYGDGQGATPYGTVYKLSPPVSGQKTWTETILYTFTGLADGGSPFAPVTFDPEGNLYGVTSYGGSGDNAGTVFELSPPGSGQTTWTETPIYSFVNGMDGYVAGLSMDASGNLFGTTPDGGTRGTCGGNGNSGCGTVFELVRPEGGGSWTEVTLHTFTGGTDGSGPFGSVLLGKDNKLFGTTQSGGSASEPDGVAFSLSPPKAGKSVWSEQVLHDFTCSTDGCVPHSGLNADKLGNLYGTTDAGGDADACGPGCGTVFELSPPSEGSQTWAEKIILDFPVSQGALFGNLVFDRAGDLYGTSSVGGGNANSGTAFEIMPPQTGTVNWTEVVLHSFDETPTDGAYPNEGLAIDKKGRLYGTTVEGGTHNSGTVFRVTP